MKKCYNCKKEKEYKEFDNYYLGKYALSSKCKECARKINNEYYNINKKKILDNYKVVVICPDCLFSYKKSNKSNHEKTMKHKNKVDNINIMILERLKNN